MRAARSEHDRTIHLWSQQDVRARPPQPREPERLRELQAEYHRVRDQARDARSELDKLRQRDRSLRHQLQTAAAQHDERDAADSLRAFKTLLAEARPVCEAIGRECRRLREAYPMRTAELLRMVDELKSTLWV